MQIISWFMASKSFRWKTVLYSDRQNSTNSLPLPPHGTQEAKFFTGPCQQMTYTLITILHYKRWHIYEHQLWFTYFIVRQESSGPSGIASFSPSVCWCVQTVVTVISQAEWLSIHGHSHHNLLGVCSLLNPVVDGEILENWKQCQYFAILQLKNQMKHLQS